LKRISKSSSHIRERSYLLRVVYSGEQDHGRLSKRPYHKDQEKMNRKAKLKTISKVK
jgi:hypothetical protein